MTSASNLFKYYAQGLVMSVPLLIVSIIDAIFQSDLKWIIIAFCVIIFLLYGNFAVFSGPKYIVPVRILKSPMSAIRLIAAGVGTWALAIAAGEFIGEAQNWIVITLFLLPIALFLIALFQVLFDEQ